MVIGQCFVTMFVIRLASLAAAGAGNTNLFQFMQTCWLFILSYKISAPLVIFQFLLLISLFLYYFIFCRLHLFYVVLRSVSAY